jgi:uncharacterized surface anchored protein
VWNDRNRDGLRSLDEPPLAGAQVVLLDEASQIVKHVVTGEDGLFEFDHLLPGRYQVREQNPLGFQSTTADKLWVQVRANTVSQLTFADYDPTAPTPPVLNTPEPGPRKTPTTGPTPTMTPSPVATDTPVPPPTVPATSTTAPTAAPTNTPAPTDTAVASPTLYPITPVATTAAVTQPVAQVLPVTGSGSLLFFWALALVIAGLVARFVRMRWW